MPRTRLEVPGDVTFEHFVDNEWAGWGGTPIAPDALIAWDSTDPNANALHLELPAGGVVDVPVLAVGIDILGRNLAHFDGLVQPMVALVDADWDSYVGYHFSADDVAVVRMRLANGTVRNHTLPNVASGTLVVTPWPSGFTIGDDQIFALGDGTDQTFINRSTALLANTVVTGVLVGAPVAQALAANSLIISNITASGDQAFYGNLGGNSIQWLFYDTSASRVYSWPNGVAGMDWTSASLTFASAASTNNQVFTLQNTSNAAAASHAIIDVQVGGTTSIGDPQLRLTVPGGTSAYFAIDNDNGDAIMIGTGTTVGASRIFHLSTITSGASIIRLFAANELAQTLSDGAATQYVNFRIDGTTATLAGQTQVTTLWEVVRFDQLTISQSGGAVTVDFVANLVTTPAAVTAGVTVTDDAGFRVKNPGNEGGTITRLHGVYFEAMTRGTNNSQITFATGVTAPAAFTDTVKTFASDIAVGDARLGFQAEAGSAIYIGNDRLRFAAATGYIDIAGTDAFTITASALTFPNNFTVGIASTAGIAASLLFDAPVGAGGAADAVVKHEFRIDSGTAVVAGLSSETDGAGSVDTATTIWRVPYRDSGVNVAAPGAPNAANNAAWNGGLRVEAGDDTNRIYFFTNEAWHYVNMTAGLSITAEERVDPWTGHEWQLNDIGVVRMHKEYGDGGADFLPYPLDQALSDLTVWRNLEQRVTELRTENANLRERIAVLEK